MNDMKDLTDGMTQGPLAQRTAALAGRLSQHREVPFH
jgi:hypothetical protein